MSPRRATGVRTQRPGQTLLELMAATSIIAATLVPSLRIMRDTIKIGRETEMANLMATLSVSKLEEHLVLTAADWSESNQRLPFPGYPGVFFQVVRELDNTAVGVTPGTLMSITATVWEDENGNQLWDAGEARSVFASKLASNVAYQREANGT